MRIAVIGAGLAGVMTAFELSHDGHEVHVLDRGAGIATEGSYANGGMMSPEYTAAWGAPGLPRRLFSPPWRDQASWGRDGAPLNAWPWLWQWRRSQRPTLAPARQAALWALGQYSRERLAQLSHQLPLDYEQQSGQVVLLRDERDLSGLKVGLDWLVRQGLPVQVLDEAGVRALEPALNPEARLHGGLHLPGGLVANSRQFAHQLKTQAQALGARWHFLREVTALEPGTPWRVISRSRDDVLEPQAHGLSQTLEVDAVVVCAAAGAPALLQTLGLQLPLRGVVGHSVTAAARLDEAHDHQWPMAGIVDERHQIAIARQGDRIRVSGGAALGHQGAGVQSAMLARLYQALDDWYPGAARTAHAMQWCGTRWLTADGLPVLGASGPSGLWLNLGLGASGWTLGCGAARVVADQIAGRPSSLETLGFGLGRERLR